MSSSDLAIAAVFPGQGSQRAGMGRDFVEEFAVSGLVFDEASDALDLDMRALCWGDDPRLDLTEFTQPAILTTEIAIMRALAEELGLQPAYFGGHSLEEYTALCAAGVIPLALAARLVRKRGALMQKATGGGMAAILGMDGTSVSKALAELGASSIDVANYNSPRQTVISGIKADIEKFAPMLKDKGARRVVILPVSGAFHSRYMKPAAEEFDIFLNDFSFSSLKISCIANCIQYSKLIIEISITSGPIHFSHYSEFKA